MKSQNGFSVLEAIVAVIIIGLIAAIAIPSLIASRRTAKESAAIANLRAIHFAQAANYAANGNTYGTFDQLNSAQLLDPSFAGASITKGSYTIAESVTGTSKGYCAKAAPDTDGKRFFGMNQSGKIYQSTVSADIDCTAGVLTTGGGAVLIPGQ
jgi:type IV pilus assembly protein PilA